MKKSKTSYGDIAPYRTRDASTIRELMHPGLHACTCQSLAEAVIDVGATTLLHRHNTTEEIYHITAGEGLMHLGSDILSVCAGDTICISPGTAHKIRNTGTEDLRIICCCCPAYSHSDTDVLENEK